MRHKLLLIPLVCLVLVFFSHRATQSFGFQFDEEAAAIRGAGVAGLEDGELDPHLVRRQDASVLVHSRAPAIDHGAHGHVSVAGSRYPFSSGV